MIKTATRMMAAAAALGLVAAPMVASANTRAGDSTAVYSTSNAAPGLGRAAAGEDQGEEGGIGAVLLTGGAVVAVVVGTLVATGVIGEDDSDCASPGAC